MCSPRATELEAGAGDLHDRFGTETIVAEVDVADAAAVRALAARVARELGPADVLVNNAGVLGPVGPFVDVDLAEWAATIRIDLVGPVHAIAAFAPQMLEAGRGRIVNLSGGGTGGGTVAPRISAYTTAKAALVALTETVARELAPAVKVNAIAPGAIATSFGDGILAAGPETSGADLYEATRSQGAEPDAIDRFLDLLEFVLSPDAAWLTGRLLSARWDPPDALRGRRAEILDSDLLTLRRVDGDLVVDATHVKTRS
jgi:NAD(P)-dependent dehydrogenase (short-subunit alcohol dehydrogenase family)